MVSQADMMVLATRYMKSLITSGKIQTRAMKAFVKEANNLMPKMTKKQLAVWKKLSTKIENEAKR